MCIIYLHNMKNQKVSVIIPSYNRLEQTESAVKSVLKQSYRNLELILVDDASTPPLDSSIFGTTHRECQLITLSENHGVSTARNRGIAKAQGEWIAFLDSDDIWSKKKLEKQIKWLSENPSYRICQTQEQWIRGGVKVNQPKQWFKKADWIFKESLERCMISPSSVIIHRSLLDEVGLFNENYHACEDYDLWLRITRTEPVGLVDQKLMTRHGGEPDQLSATVPLQDKYRLAALESILKEDLTEEQRELVIGMIRIKAEIVSNGFLKRGKSDEAQEFLDILNRYQ